ncbi:hypothetical protein Pla100_34870 [Neorhodopirellula pilleata]|uniref:Uncharacterized protein n=1 Tax=Neorhodopirellula pilleata TaxID=2714738 RepID=A0A5C6A4S9_9BACT|nr:hypothetical protein Pla100_34870 [Neorhodopirellula pilleata]
MTEMESHRTKRCTSAAKWGVLKWKISRRGDVIANVLATRCSIVLVLSETVLVLVIEKQL